jgi:hypothetical protein
MYVYVYVCIKRSYKLHAPLMSRRDLWTRYRAVDYLPRYLRQKLTPLSAINIPIPDKAVILLV